MPVRPAPAMRTRSGHSRFLHRLPPLATGVGDVGAAAVHGAQPTTAAATPRALAAGSPGPGVCRDDGGGRRRVPRSRARSTCVLSGQWRGRRASAPRLPQAPTARASPGELPGPGAVRGGQGAETREQGGAGAVYTGGGGAAMPAGEAARAEEKPGPSI